MLGTSAILVGLVLQLVVAPPPDGDAVRRAQAHADRGEVLAGERRYAEALALESESQSYFAAGGGLMGFAAVVTVVGAGLLTETF